MNVTKSIYTQYCHLYKCLEEEYYAILMYCSKYWPDKCENKKMSCTKSVLKMENVWKHTFRVISYTEV